MSEEPTFYLPWRQEWRVFTAQKHLYSNGVWMELDNIKDLTGKPKAMHAFFEDFQKLQWLCWHDGLIGWFCAVAKDNPRMATLINAAGGAIWREDDTYRYFYKHTTSMPEVLSFQNFHQRTRESEAPVCPS